MHSISTGTVNCAVLATSTSVLAVKRSTGVAERDPLDQPPPRARRRDGTTSGFPRRPAPTPKTVSVRRRAASRFVILVPA